MGERSAIEAPTVEERFGFLDHVPTGMFVLREDQVILFWNRRLEAWTDLSRDEVIGRRIGDLFPRLSAPRYTIRLRSVFEGGPPVVFSAQLHKYIIPAPLRDGQLRIQHTTVTPVPASDGTGFHALFAIQDVTDLMRRVREYRAMRDQALNEASERKRVEETLRQRNRELGLLHRAGQAFSSTLDLDQLLTTVLTEVRRQLKVIACSIWLTDPETGELVCRQAIGPQSDVVRGWRLPPGEGFVGWVALTGEHLIVSDTWADERHFRGVDEQTGLALRAFLSVPLRVKQDVIGVLQVMDSEVGRFGETDVMLLEPLAASAAIAIDNARLVEALRQHTVALETSNSELDAFAQTVAHDLKGPLANIVGFAEALASDHASLPDDDLRRYLQTIARNGHKMTSIINSLLVLAGARKVEDIALRPLDMASIVGEVQERLAYMIKEHQAEIILPDAWPVALGYEPWVEEVWINYVSNAIKYGGRPPRVELGFDEPASQPIGESANQSAGAPSHIRFWVRDNGPGLSPQDRSRLFAPFTRLDPTRAQGHGLGLSIVQRIVEKLGGDVDVESALNEGSVFSFTLPNGEPIQGKEE